MTMTKLRTTPSAFEAACAALKEKDPALGMWFAGLANVHTSIVNLTIDSTHPKAEQTAEILTAAKVGGRTGQAIARIVAALRGIDTDESESGPVTGSSQVAAMAVAKPSKPAAPEPEDEKDKAEGGEEKAPEPKKLGPDEIAPFSTQEQIDAALQPHVPFATRFKEFLASLPPEDEAK